MLQFFLSIIGLQSLILFMNIHSIDASSSRGSTLFVFHLENKGIGDDVSITLEGENGQAIQWRDTLFISHNIERYDELGYFQPGDRVTACIVNYDENNYDDCDTTRVHKFNTADFFLKVARY